MIWCNTRKTNITKLWSIRKRKCLFLDNITYDKRLLFSFLIIFCLVFKPILFVIRNKLSSFHLKRFCMIYLTNILFSSHPWSSLYSYLPLGKTMKNDKMTKVQRIMLHPWTSKRSVYPAAETHPYHCKKNYLFYMDCLQYNYILTFYIQMY